MSSGFESRSSRRHHALRKSVVTETVDRAGLSAGALKPVELLAAEELTDNRDIKLE